LKLNKLRFIAIFLVVFLFCSCSERDSEYERLLNAQGYTGADFTKYSMVSQVSAPQTPDGQVPLDNEQTESDGEQSAVIDETAGITETLVTPFSTTAVTGITTTETATATVSTTSTVTTTVSTTTSTVSTTTSTVATTVSTTTATTTTPAKYTPLNYSEVRGVWISYLELKSAFSGGESFRAAFAKMMDNCKALGINTVYVHVRAFGDAFYQSELFPWSKYITGSLGVAPDYDPLAIMTEEAHSRGISFHGWINPMRLPAAADINKVSADFPVGKWYNGDYNGTYIVKAGEFYYLNPAYPEARRLIADGAAEILKNYEVDGLHIDDYFYPPSCANTFDGVAFSKSGKTDVSEFRLENCTAMVKLLYDTVKGINPSLLFGISPQGSVSNCYDIYADVKLWASKAGYCDYIAPQIYYGFKNAAQPFDKCLSGWEDIVKSGKVKLIPGLAVYKVGNVDAWAGESGKNEWINSDDIIKRQVELSKNAANYGGVIFYSYNYLTGGY